MVEANDDPQRDFLRQRHVRRCRFLAGLTAHDVLHNRSVPRSLSQSWLGALKQLLPESAASAVHAAHPSFRQLYDHVRQADAAGAAGGLAELRVGAKRLGPARSKRVRRLLTATQEQASEAYSEEAA